LRLELDDLPPRYRAQAEAQLLKHARGAAAVPEHAAREFESRGEYEYYMREILPKKARGELAKVTAHAAFELLPAKEYGNVKLPAARYTADFVLEYATGEVEVVEIKSKFTRRAQRDYIYRRRLFIDLVAEPRGWKFTEVITPDTRDELRAWKQAAKERR